MRYLFLPSHHAFHDSMRQADTIRNRGVDSLFVSAGDSPHLIDNLSFVPEGKRPSAAIDAVDNQIVIAAHNAREQETLYSRRNEFSGQFHRGAQIILIETSRLYRVCCLR